MLCRLLGAMLKKERITGDTRVELEASGGHCFEEDLRNFDKTESEMDLILAKFPADVEDAINYKRHRGRQPTLTLKEKKKWVCSYYQNQLLVQYYQRYGLEPEDSQDLFSTPMSGQVKGILDACR